MKYFFLIPLVWLFFSNSVCGQNIQNTWSSQNQLDTFFDESNTFFSNHITDGAINYEAIQKDSTLNYLIEQIQTADINQTDSITQTAFLINAYNLNALAEIVNLLPLSSIIYKETLFNEILITVAGKRYTFDQLKNERLALIATNPLFHFALIQTSLSFPMLPNYAFKQNQLNEQLETQTRKVINHPNFLKLDDRSITIPRFLKWYKKELVDQKGSILEFIKKYYNFDGNLTKPIQFKRKLKYTKVNHWALNYYLEATKTDANTLATTWQMKPQFNKYMPSALIRKGGIEIQSINSINANGESYTSNLQYRENSLQGKFGINPSVNIGFLVNFDYSKIYLKIKELYSVGPQIWFKPFKKYDNFVIENGFMFPLFKEDYYPEWQRYYETNGPSLYSKFKFYNKIAEKFLLDVSVGLSIENLSSKIREYQTTISLPTDISLHYYIHKRIRLHSTYNFTPHKSGEIKAIDMLSKTGIAYTCSPKMEISFLYGLIYNKYWKAKTVGRESGFGWTHINLDFRFSF